MYIQEQLAWNQVDDERLRFLKAIGVDYLTIYPTMPELSDGRDRTDYWLAMKRLAETHGLILHNVATGGWESITRGCPIGRRRLKPGVHSYALGGGRYSDLGVQLQTCRQLSHHYRRLDGASAP
ncbi:MAG: hypothetical protein R3E79_37835 [Caldilineaceae bacterium]